MGDLSAAMSAWRDLLGAENALSSDELLDRVSTATFRTSQRVSAVIRPRDRSEVQECVRIANRTKTPIYPVSAGKNWGYGSRVPPRDGCAILDLGRMNRIIDYDEEMAYATIEPGVTFRQLHAFLREKRSKLLLSVTGSSPDSSVIGNAVERGHGKGPYGDRFNHVCALEVVLPTGECIHTGLDRFDRAASASLARFGLGPHIDGLFTQSNLGIVTRLTHWLMPAPEHFQTLFYSIRDPSKLSALIDALRGLKLGGLLPGSFVVYNDYRLLSFVRQFPWEETAGRTPLTRADMSKFDSMWRGTSWGGTWNGEGALYSATKAQARADRRAIKRALRGIVDKFTFVDSTRARVAELIAGPIRLITGRDIREMIRWALAENPFNGVPMERGLRMAYWRKREPVPAEVDPDRDRCGVLWFTPAVPFRGRDVKGLVELIESICLAHGFEPNLGLNCAEERSIDMTASLVYDRDVPGEDDRAMACYHEMRKRSLESGFVPYRMSIESMRSPIPVRDDYAHLMRTLKQALDPENILAPGRYIE